MRDVLLERGRPQVPQHLDDMPGDQGQRTQRLDGVAQRAAPGHEPDRADVTRGQRGGEEGCGGPAEVDGELLGARDGVHDVYVPQAVGAAEPLLQTRG